MAVVADIDGLDLWVEPHDWTDEERDEVKRFIEERRGQGAGLTFLERTAELLAKVRASSATPRTSTGKVERSRDVDSPPKG